MGREMFSDIVKHSALRLNDSSDGNWVATYGTPIPVEIAISTTMVKGMDFGVDAILGQLPSIYELISEMLPGHDIQIALGIYKEDDKRFGFKRTQFGTVDALTKAYSGSEISKNGNVENRDSDELQYSLFAAAYLTDTYINKVGLKGYFFYVSGAKANTRFSLGRLKNLFGSDVVERANANIKKVFGKDKTLTEALIESMTINDVLQDLSTLSHVFIVQVGDTPALHDFWNGIRFDTGVGSRIDITSIRELPEVMAVAIGMAEGTLAKKDIFNWFINHGATWYGMDRLTYQLERLPTDTQAELRLKLEHNLPRVGDILKSKTDLWPM